MLGAWDREDTLGFGSDRTKMTTVAALGAGLCLENEVVGDLTASYKRPSALCAGIKALDALPFSSQMVVQCVHARVDFLGHVLFLIFANKEMILNVDYVSCVFLLHLFTSKLNQLCNIP